ncbi:hypothetical protein MIND_01329700 [Mycena indigotica]|uniref:Uncharacterized protein n=1 Tax=Mycena indigotica TaxID=2126181 RepID=A0A8H6RYM9_9AGAR|nr:uncharacterized protein MIND_01329700 [Mycena indigotica]KAF7290165.1 hypothetical protein MIND_01329700 [Mycena indigotica]
MQGAEALEAIVGHRVRLDGVLSANVAIQHALDSYSSHPITATDAALKQMDEQASAQQEYNELQDSASNSLTTDDIRLHIRERRAAIGALEAENAVAEEAQDQELLKRLAEVYDSLADDKSIRNPPKTTQELVRWLSDQTDIAQTRQKEMLEAIERADKVAANPGVRDVLTMRLTLQEDIIQLRLKAATIMRRTAVGMQAIELVKVETAHAIARARGMWLKRDIQAEFKAAQKELAFAKRNAKSNGVKRKSISEAPPSSPKRPRREAAPSFGSPGPSTAPSMTPPTTTAISTTPKPSTAAKPPATTKTSATTKPTTTTIAKPSTTTKSATMASTSASSSLPPRLAKLALSGKPRTAVPAPLPVGELPTPPVPFTDWGDFYQSDESLLDMAQAQSRAQASMDPRTDLKRFRASYGPIVVMKRPCGICVKYDLPCLYVDTAQNPFHPPGKPPRCIVCQEWKFHCNPRAGSSADQAAHVHAEHIVGYHNAAIAAGERPGMWMGKGVAELKLVGSKRLRVKSYNKDE